MSAVPTRCTARPPGRRGSSAEPQPALVALTDENNRLLSRPHLGRRCTLVAAAHQIDAKAERDIDLLRDMNRALQAVTGVSEATARTIASRISGGSIRF